MNHVLVHVLVRAPIHAHHRRLIAVRARQLSRRPQWAGYAAGAQAEARAVRGRAGPAAGGGLDLAQGPGLRGLRVPHQERGAAVLDAILAADALDERGQLQQHAVVVGLQVVVAGAVALEQAVHQVAVVRRAAHALAARARLRLLLGALVVPAAAAAREALDAPQLVQVDEAEAPRLLWPRPGRDGGPGPRLGDGALPPAAVGVVLEVHHQVLRVDRVGGERVHGAEAREPQGVVAAAEAGAALGPRAGPLERPRQAVGQRLMMR